MPRTKQTRSEKEPSPAVKVEATRMTGETETDQAGQDKPGKTTRATRKTAQPRAAAQPAAQAGHSLTPEVEAALARAAEQLPLSPAAIVDTAVRDWLRTWCPGLL